MNTREDYNPLVSVGVLTYNSSKTVLETLESIKAQTYQNIELIISDDASKDNTVEICKEWVEKNKDRFVRCEILTVPENTGIPANVNRRIAASRGEWSKGIAADDALLPDCIENFINYVKEHPEAEIIFAKAKIYTNYFDEKNFTRIYGDRAKWFCENFKTAEEQYKQLLRGIYCNACTMFAKLEILQKIKYDEDFPAIEDYPMWLRLTKAGIRFYFMDKFVVNYRSSASSISGNNRNLATLLSFWLKVEPFKEKYIYPEKSILFRLMHKLRKIQYVFFQKIGLLNSSNSKLKTIILKILYYSTSPHLWRNYILKKELKKS